MSKTAASYFEAARPEPVRVLGLLLKPFCLGHYITLNRFDSAFVAEEARKVTREDVIFAALVCHYTFEDFYVFMGQADAPRQIKTWGKRCGMFPIKEKAILLREYIRTASELPPHVILKQDDNQSGAHWSQAMRLCLTGELGYSQSEALNAPLKQAFADWFKFADSNQILHLLNDDELATIEALKEENGAQT